MLMPPTNVLMTDTIRLSPTCIANSIQGIDQRSIGNKLSALASS